MNVIKKYPVYRKFLLNIFVSTMGDSMYYIALMMYASQFANSGLAIMIVSISEAIPHLFSAILGGVADMSSHRTQKVLLTGVVRGILYFVVGIMIGFQPSLMILTGIACINFVSDLIGKYSNSLTMPFLPLIVESEDMEEASGLSGAMGQLVSLVANFVGAFLIGLFSYRLLAFINSGTFFLSVLIIISIRHVLQQLQDTHFDKPQKVTARGITKQIVQSMKELAQNKELFRLILIFAVVNGLFSTLFPLLSMILAKEANMIIRNFAFTIALVEGILAVGVIFGGLLGPKLLRKWSIAQMNPLIVLSMLVFTMGLFLQSIGLLLFISSFTGFLIGAVNPKINAAVLKEIPVDKLGTVIGGMNTLLMSVPPLTISLFSTLGATLGLKPAVGILAILCLCLFVYVLFQIGGSYGRAEN